MYHGEYKVPGGKLIKVSFSLSEGVIESIRFTGDFFLHPETALSELEEHLVGEVVDETALSERIASFFDDGGVQAIGCSANDFAHVVVLAVQHAP